MVQPIVAERFDVVSVMTTDEARSCVNAINGHMNSARALLLDLYERRGWEVLGYSSWRACVVAEFEQGEKYLYQLLQAARIDQRISAPADIGRIPEKQLRPLSQLDPEDQPIAWAEANARSNGKPTGPIVTQVVTEMRGAPTRFTTGMRSSETPEWYTPDHIIERVIQVFGQIDLDPCSNSSDPEQANVPALAHWTQADDGLLQVWCGKVYMNPPYGDQIAPWIPRLIDAYATDEIEAAIVLLPGRTDTDWFEPLLAYPICFVHGRLRFSGAENSAPFPSVVVYFGADLPAFARAFAPLGRIMVPYT